MKASDVAMIFYMAIAVGTICMIAALVQKPDRIPCDVVEISPDVSNKDREYCRLFRQRQAAMRHHL